MGTKMKGVLKGLRYITQIFENEKEPEIQIGFPTDVKHLAHIGSDGPSPTDEAPSWMKEYKPSEGGQNANEDGKENSDVSKWGSQDSLSQRSSGPQTNTTRDLPDLPKPARRHSLADDSSTSSPKGSKSRQSRRNSSDSSKSQKQKDSAQGSESPSRLLPSLPKKSSRKKSKESSVEGSRRSRKRDVSSDSGQDRETNSGNDRNKLVESSSLKPGLNEEDKG